MSVSRFVVAFAAWLVLKPSLKPGDLALGAAAAALACWASARLAPPDGRPRVGALASIGYLPRFLLQSLRGGFDVAGRALARDMRLRPGYVDVPTALPRGFARHAFTTITSLMPGSLPCADAARTLRYHCLDTTQPVADQIQDEERVLTDALAPPAR